MKHADKIFQMTSMLEDQTAFTGVQAHGAGAKKVNLKWHVNKRVNAH